jgi:hypothetical protein
VYLVGIDIHYRMIHGPYNIKLITSLNVMKENCCNLTGRLQSTALTTETLKFLEVFIMKIILSLIITLNQSAPVKIQMR